MRDFSGGYFLGLATFALIALVSIVPIQGCEEGRCGEKCAAAGLNFYKHTSMNGCLCREKSRVVNLREVAVEKP